MFQPAETWPRVPNAEYSAAPTVEVPMTVVQSTHVNEKRDRVSLQPGETTPWLELVRDRAPHAQIALVPGVGHFSMIEAPEDVNRHMEAILEKLAGG